MRAKYLCHFVVFSLMLWAGSGCKKETASTESKGIEAASCAQNLATLAQGKKMWAEKNQKGANDAPTMADLSSFVRHPPGCPAGGTYTLGKVSEAPTCSIAEHNEAYKKLAP